MSETLDLFTAALVSGEPWQGDSLGFRRGGGSGWICTWISRGGAFRGCGAGLRAGFCPGARHGGRDVAAHGFFSVQGVPARAGAAAMIGEHDTRIWRVLDHHVAVQGEKLSLADVRRVGMDETSARNGQDCVSTFIDLDAR